jgi:hypothetical protein
MTDGETPVSAIGPAHRRAHAVMIGLVALLGVVWLLFGERFPFGFVWDTDWYADEAAHFWERAVVERLNGYRLQRVLPSAIVWLGMRAVGATPTLDNAGTGFLVLDILLLVATALVWRSVADRLELSHRARWLGFLGLFANYAIVKHAFYMPAMTEIAAYALGMSALLLFLDRRRVALFALGLIGGFVFPTVGPSVALMLLWPARGGPIPDRDRSILGDLVALAWALAFAAIFLYFYLYRGARGIAYGPVTPVVDVVWPLSLALTVGTMFLGLRVLLRGIDVDWVRRALRALDGPGVLMAIGTLVIPALLVKAIQSAPSTVMTPKLLLAILAFQPNARPLAHLVAHAVWFGPLVIVLVLRWRAVTTLAWRLGPGLVAALAFGFLIAMTPETRQSSFEWPILVALLVAALDQARETSTRLLGVVIVGSVLTSQFWRRLTTPEMLIPVPDLDRAQAAFVFREYLASTGLWMSNRAYLLHLAVLLPLAVSLAWLMFGRRERDARLRDVGS